MVVLIIFVTISTYIFTEYNFMIEGIYDHLQKDFERAYKRVDDSPFTSRGLVSYYDVLKAHYLIADYFISEGEEVTYGLKDSNILGSALGRQITGYGEFQKWKEPVEICATLFYGLIKNHAFHDANKRTALLTLLYQLYRFGKTTTVRQVEFESLAVNVAMSNYRNYKKFEKFKNKEDGEILFLADFIRSATRNIDKKFYPVTFQQFNTLLKKHDCYIEDASGNYADIKKIRKEKGFLGLNTKEKHVRVLQIGFPGWKRQVNPKALKEVLKACELTEHHGVDSHSFFHNGEPLNALIDIYSGPLRRLKDR